MSAIDDIKDLIEALEGSGATVVVNINIAMGEPAGSPPAPPPPPPAPPNEVVYLVNVPDKPSKRAKVRPVASLGSAEIDFVYHNEYVKGPGKEVNGMIFITDRVGDPVLPGFVEKQYLIAQ